MKIYKDFENISQIKNPVVTTGLFDGVHYGHTVIFNKMKDLAQLVQGETVVITFHPHPQRVLFPEKSKMLKFINTIDEKLSIFEKNGIDHVFIIEFSKEFSKITSVDYVNNILLEKLKAKVIVVGYNHQFGYKGEGDQNFLKQLSNEKDFILEVIPEQEVQDENISSEKIRHAIKTAQIMRANVLLNHHFFISGDIQNPTKDSNANDDYQFMIPHSDKVTPPAGRYAGKVKQSGISTKCLLEIIPNNIESIIKIYCKKTFENNKHSIIKIYRMIRIFENHTSDFTINRDQDLETLNELIF